MAEPWDSLSFKSTAINLALCLQTWNCIYFGWFILSFYGFVSNSCATFEHVPLLTWNFTIKRKKCAHAWISIELIEKYLDVKEI